MSDEYKRLYQQTTANYIAYWFDYLTRHRAEHHKLNEELANITLALQKAADNERVHALREIVHREYAFWETQGYYDEIERYINWLQPHLSSEGSSSDQATNLLLLGRLALRQEQYDQATAYWDQALSLAESAELVQLTCDLQRELGSMHTHLRQYERAASHLESARNLAASLSDDPRKVMVLGELCRLHFLTGELEIASDFCREAETIALMLEDELRLSGLKVYRGAILYSQKQLAEALTIWQQGLGLVEEVGHLERKGFLLANLGMVATELENYGLAEEYLRRGIELARRLGNSMTLSHQLMDLGLLLAEQSRLPEARKIMDQSIEVARDIQDVPLLLLNLGKYGECELKQDNPSEAEHLFSIALKSLAETDSNKARQKIAGRLHWGMARACRAAQKPAQARRSAATALELFSLVEDTTVAEIRHWLEEF